MSRILLATVAALFVFGAAAAAFAGIPDPDLSYVELDNGGCILATCPAGDGPPFQYVNVYAKRSDGTPIEGILPTEFAWDVFAPCSVTITAVDPATNAIGLMRFEVVGDEECCCDYVTEDPSVITLEVWIRGIKINDSDDLLANSFDMDCDSDVDPVDFALFAGLFGGGNICADYDCNGQVNPVDFALFAAHFGH